jgi:hypothetical protein
MKQDQAPLLHFTARFGQPSRRGLRRQGLPSELGIQQTGHAVSSLLPKTQTPKPPSASRLRSYVLLDSLSARAGLADDIVGCWWDDLAAQSTCKKLKTQAEMARRERKRKPGESQNDAYVLALRTFNSARTKAVEGRIDLADALFEAYELLNDDDYGTKFLTFVAFHPSAE